MRQLAILPERSAAERFAAYLQTQRIDAQAEEAASGGFAIWVRDEDQLPQAREHLAHFQAHPDDARYATAERDAAELARQEEAKRRAAQGNVVQMRGRWGNAPGMEAGPRKAPLTLALIALSVLSAFVTYSDTFEDPTRGREFGETYRALLFADPLRPVDTDERPSMWTNVLAGQVWRLLTPIFIHYGLAHLILNMIWLYSFGSQVEDRRGSLFFLLLVLFLAVTSNVGQALEAEIRQMGSQFGGMSGVGYGLFGFMFIKARYDNRDRYFLSPVTSFMALLWFVLCILRDVPGFSSLLQDAIPPIANAAHAVGLAVGAAVAYVPILLKKPA